MKLVLLLCICVHLVKGDPLAVPHEVMDFILDCRSNSGRSAFSNKVPVYRTDIEPTEGIVTQTVGIMNLEELKTSLKNTVSDDETVQHIVDKVTDRLQDPSFKRAPTQCPYEKKIEITVPPLRMREFKGELAQILQQNNYRLLENYNVLLAYRLHEFSEKIEKAMKQRMNKMSDKIDYLINKLDEKFMLDVNKTILGGIDDSGNVTDISTESSTESISVENFDESDEEYDTTTMYPEEDDLLNFDAFVRTQQAMPTEPGNSNFGKIENLVPQSFLTEELPKDIFTSETLISNEGKKIYIPELPHALEYYGIKQSEPNSQNPINKQEKVTADPVSTDGNLNYFTGTGDFKDGGITYNGATVPGIAKKDDAGNFEASPENTSKDNNGETQSPIYSNLNQSPPQYRMIEDSEMRLRAGIPPSSLKDVQKNYRESVVQILNSNNRRSQLMNRFIRNRLSQKL